MSVDKSTTERVSSFCALCVSRCGAVATLENGKFTALEPDPTHPTGAALCIKGRVAPELVYHPDRLLHPMKRTRPKGDSDPGWQRISWDEALNTVADKLKRLADQHGPESVVFTTASPSTSALSDSLNWIQRLRKAFGTPNHCLSMELCGWGRYLASQYVYGAAVPGEYLPDLDHADCILFWGYNPTVSRITHATATVAALKRGARLIVVDPRRAGLAGRADHWLQVRPGSDGALALGLANVMIERGWYDRDFIRDWTNAALLVRSDNGNFLREADLRPSGAKRNFVAWDEAAGKPAAYDPDRGMFDGDVALFGTFDIETADGIVACHPVFQLTADMCARYPTDTVERLTGVAADDIEAAARTLWEARPTAFYSWSGVEQQTNATQIARAIALLYSLTGNFDTKGGNVLFPGVPTGDIVGEDLLDADQRGKALGLGVRPLGPSRFQHVTSSEIYRGILEQEPYAVRGLISFGSNLLVAHADGERGRQALAALDFHVHADQFMNPTAELADIVLPVTSPFESEGLNIGFEISEAARSLVQLRKPLVEPRGEARSDIDITFDLACRLGLGRHFWDGDIDAAYRHQLAPSGIALETLRENPAGVRVPLETRYRKFAEPRDGAPTGFNTQTRKIEFYSETMLRHGYPALPDYEEPLVGPHSRPDLAARYPLLLTCAKDTLYCESQHRGLPSLRRRALDPQVDLHPSAAAARAIAAGDWVAIETPNGRVRARARLNATLDPRVVCGQHGWWQACPEIGAPGFEAFGPDSANFNLVIGHNDVDPVSGSVPLRAYVCEITPLT